MVQRKVPNKLGIQATYDKSDKRHPNTKLSSSQNQESKKKMKKSRSIKVSDMESLKSPHESMMEVPQVSPNYMKSTSSSKAKNDQNSQSGSDSKAMMGRNSNSNSNSKLGSVSPKTPSLKLVRTLTKTPSFKLSRTSKKCSQAVLCADMQKATCSSTLKDSKFPAYLTLSPGSTESEGTSAMKVCPYTYCSLNGHHHAPLPPLKCFISARRRSLKTQKSLKLEGLSPRPKPRCVEKKKEIDTGQDIVVEKPANGDVGFDFLIEIYAKSKDSDDDGEKVGELNHEAQQSDISEVYNLSTSLSSNSEAIGVEKPVNDEEGLDLFLEIYAKSPIDDSEEAIEGSIHVADDGEKLEELNHDAAESEIDTSERSICIEGGGEKLEDTNGEEPESEIDFDNNLDYDDEEAMLESLWVEYELEAESHGSISSSESESEANDMEWEEGELPNSNPDDDASNTNQNDAESDLKIRYFVESEKPVFISDDTISSCYEEIVADEVLQEIFEEELSCYETRFGDYDSELENLETEALEETQMEEEDTTDEEGEDQIENRGTVTEEHEVFEVSKIEQFGEDEIVCTNDAVVEESNDVATMLLIGYELVDSSKELDEIDQEEANAKDYNGSHETVEDKVLKIDDVIEVHHYEATKDTDPSQAIVNESLPVIAQDENMFVDRPESSDDVTNETQLLQDQGEAEKFIISCDLDAEVQRDSEFNEIAEGNATKIDVIEAHHFEAVHEDISSSQANVVESMPYATQDDITSQTQLIKDRDEAEELMISCLNSEVQRDSESVESCLVEESITEPNGMENQEISEVEKDPNEKIDEVTEAEVDLDEAEKSKVLTSSDFEGQKKSNLEEPILVEVDKTEAEDQIKPVSTKQSLRTNKITAEEPFETFENRNRIIRNKKSTMDTEELLRGFNPREPNYLPLEDDPEGEKVDLRHQMMDDRKNAEEWMLDYALQRAVSKLAPARKKKVALLVEAFETVSPMPKFQNYRRHSLPAFTHGRQIQACS